MAITCATHESNSTIFEQSLRMSCAWELLLAPCLDSATRRGMAAGRLRLMTRHAGGVAR